MRLTTLFLITGILQVTAGTTLAQRITLSERNSSLATVLDHIRTQTGYDFFYEDVNIEKLKNINLSVKDADLKNVLSRLLTAQNLEYVIEENSVIIKEKKLGFIERLAERLNSVDISGVIVDEAGTPLPGATLSIKGTNFKFVTNQTGQFSFPVNNPDAVLVISYVGYKTMEYKLITITSFLTVRMARSEASLDDVSIVSTGYQRLPKERATGSFKVITNEQLNKPATSIAQRLVGTTAGMQATVDPNGNTTFRIRGLTSLTASADPLVVVDGFPIQGSFDNINPNNVESITILKDAAAASIWGARSANGVIVVTTKSGKLNQPFTVDVSAFTRIGSKMDMDYVRPQASSSETVEFEKLAFGKWGATPNAGSVGSIITPVSRAFILLNENRLGFISADQMNAGLEQLKTQDNKQQISDLLLQNPISNQLNLNMSGASERMTNALSLLYETNKADFKGNDNTRTLINYRTQAKLFNWLDLNLSTMFQYNKLSNNGVTLEDIQGISPYEMLLNGDGSYTDVTNNYYTPALVRYVPMAKFPYADWSYNPVREVNARNFTTEHINARIQAGLTAKIIAGLTLSSNIQYENFNTMNRNLANEDSYQVRNLLNSTATWNKVYTGAVSANLPKGSILDQNRGKSTGYVFRNQLNFNKELGTDHSINFIAGTEIRSTVSQTFTNPTTYGYNDETLSVGAFPNGAGGTYPRFSSYSLTAWPGNTLAFGYTNSFTYITDRYFSSFANLGYTFKDKYTLSGSFRTDASNLIAADPKFRYSPFWSVGGSWQLAKEDFMKTVSWVDMLTARVTYGYNGNEDRSTSPNPLINIASAPNSVTNETVATIGSYGNPTLRWEKTGTVNAGVDFSLLSGKLYGSIDMYNKKGKDLLANLSIPSVNGTTSQRLNNVEMYNRGIDLDLGTALKINKNIGWRGNMTFSYNDNKITNLYVVRYTGSTLSQGGTEAYVEGENASAIWSYQYAGLSNDVPVVTGADGALYNLNESPSADGRTYMKNSGISVAPYTLGFTNSFDIYDFNLSFIITGKFGHSFRRTGFNYPTPDFGKVIPNSRLTEVLAGSSDQIVTLPLNDNEPNYRSWGNGMTPYMDYLIENASHLRMQEVNLSYNVKQSFLRKYKLCGVRLFAQGNNLFTVVNNTYNEDPEYRIGTQKPQPLFTFGLKLQL